MRLGKRQLHANCNEYRAHGPVEPVAHARETGAHALLAEQQRHQAEPDGRRHRQVHAVTGLDRQRRMRVDHHGEQRQEKQRRLGVQAIGDEARNERATGGPFTDFLVQVFLGRLGRCLLYTSPSPRDRQKSRMPSSA